MCITVSNNTPPTQNKHTTPSPSDVCSPSRVCVALQHDVCKAAVVEQRDVAAADGGCVQVCLVKDVEGVQTLQASVVVADQTVNLQQQ